MKGIEYLELEICTYHSKKVILDRYNINCNIEGNFRHDLCTENSQLNSLIDFFNKFK